MDIGGSILDGVRLISDADGVNRARHWSST